MPTCCLRPRHATLGLWRRDSVAVVIGGAFAGLASAGWLSELFDKVLVLERDAVPTEQADALRLLEELSTPGVSAQVRHAGPHGLSSTALAQTVTADECA